MVPRVFFVFCLTMVSATQTIQMSNDWMVMEDELKTCGWKRPLPNLRYYSDICVNLLRKTTKNLSPLTRCGMCCENLGWTRCFHLQSIRRSRLTLHRYRLHCGRFPQSTQCLGIGPWLVSWLDRDIYIETTGTFLYRFSSQKWDQTCTEMQVCSMLNKGRFLFRHD
jgi:hypothetical protein